jgi:hypothetical protein
MGKKQETVLVRDIFENPPILNIKFGTVAISFKMMRLRLRNTAGMSPNCMIIYGQCKLYLQYINDQIIIQNDFLLLPLQF